MATKKWIGTDGSYSTSGNWSPSGVPTNGDTVRLPPGGGAITSGLDQSAVALVDFIVEKGYTAAIGSASLGYLKIDADKVIFEGTGAAWLDMGSAACDFEVNATQQPTTGNFGLYIKGSAIDDIAVTGSSVVGIAVNAGETATVQDIRVAGAAASVQCGAGVTLTNSRLSAGKVHLKCAATLVQTYNGETRTSEAGAITTTETYGGTLVSNSIGTITTNKCYGGTVDFTQSAAVRTVTSTEIYSGATLRIDPSIVTMTNKPQLMEPMTLSTSS